MNWLAAAVLLHAANQALGDEPAALPSFEELEAQGAIVGTIRIDPRDVFDQDDNRLFRLASRFHLRTRPESVAQQLQFKSGERVSARAIAESERLLRANRHLHEVEIRPAAFSDGVVDIDVITHDAWTLDPGVSFARSGGANAQRFYLNERNLLGRGISVGVARSANADRGATQLTFSDQHVFGPWMSLDASASRLTDGEQWSVALGRPFYAANTPWSAGLSASRSDLLNSVYDRGERTAAYRAQQSGFKASAGTAVLADQAGWVHRYSGGFDYQGNTYAAQAGVPAPDPLPQDRVFSGPFVGYEVLNESHEKVVNRDQIGRPEYFALGTKTSVQLGLSSTHLGATVDGWLVSLSASRGMHVFGSHSLFAAASLAGRLEQSQRQNQLLSASARYFVPQGNRAVFAVSASADVYRHPDQTTPLQLGGDNGLRGYPLNFQSGERRFLMSFEERVYTNWYPYHMVRIGGALFADFGRAWHGSGERSTGVLMDAGIGLRFQNPRSASGGVVHLDLAFPVNAPSDIKAVQILLKSQTSF